ncbi:CdaR family protein [Tissierella creatinophila]|uniref:YbbR-like protein n=1 Tax=Tissierella creatinophila DSM 6911 TaxID=1123403 RepID=A0A1U7M460_TISCR|nr:CdaR family protein [Tissierella creatinophila]OLS02081.1 YbbR-like protein [Tissierella creatinophila DSM 6911]
MSKVKNNWTAKVFALLISIFLWSYVMSEVNPIIKTDYKDVNVRLTNISSLDRQGLVVMDPKIATIDVTVTGKKSDMDRFTSANIIAEADLEGYSEGEMKVSVNVKLLNTAYDVKIVNHEPREILFKIDKVISKEVSVNIQTVGEVPEGYILEEINKKPQNIMIRGPRTWVNEVSEARAVVDLTNRTSSAGMSVPVQLLNDKGDEVRGIEKDPGIVDISIDISKAMKLPIELETINELPENININDIKIYPSTVMVKGSGDFSKLKKIKTKAIDINTLIGQTSMDIELALPEGVKLVDPKQKISISYSVEEIVEKEYIFSSDEISIKNLGENLKVKKETLPSEVKVILKGPKSIFNNISKDNVKLYLDLKDFLKGINKIDLKIEDIQGITIKSIDPTRTDIELEEVAPKEIEPKEIAPKIEE